MYFVAPMRESSSKGVLTIQKISMLKAQFARVTESYPMIYRIDLRI